MPEEKPVRAKIEVIYKDAGVPEVKLFGPLTANDIRFAKVFIQRQYHAWIMELNRKAKQSIKEKQKKQKEKANSKVVTANKEEKNESGITTEIKTGSGNSKTSSSGSGTSSGRGNSEFVSAT